MAVTNQAGQIKSLQRGTIQLSSVSSNTATISPVNTAKSELRYLGSIEIGGYTAPNSYEMSLTLTNSTTITAIRGAATGASQISWELTEWY